MTVALVIGSAASMAADLDAAESLLAVQRRVTVAVNRAGETYAGRLDHWVTLHPDRLPQWRRARADLTNQTPISWTAARRDGDAQADRVVEDIDTTGSSGLFAVRLSLAYLGASRVILAGMPIDDSPHFYEGHLVGPSYIPYRPAWAAAARDEFQGRVRSFSGWTRRFLGKPNVAWLAGDQT